MQTEKIISTSTVAAAAALTRKRFVSFTGTVPAAGAACLGIATTNFDLGEQASADTHGEILVEAGAAIAVGVEVETDASGRAVTKNTGIAFGRARDAATAAGDFIRVLR